MAQGLDLKSWNSDKSPSMDSKGAETGKKARGVGSRRIFPPQFKLQVLDSYRNDLDCRGNQRATARKYNIHRRQIQKWLQCEHNLRTTVEENAKNELLEPKPPKNCDSEEDKTDLTVSQSATAFARLGDAARAKENNPETKPDSGDYSKLEAQNLKRVAQKLYPSLQPIPCAQPQITHSQNFFAGDVAPYAFLLPPSPPDTRDDNFNKLIPTDDSPLDLKSKVRSEMLPESLASNASEPLPDDRPPKLSIRSPDDSAPDDIQGQKLSVPNAALKCTGDIHGREFFAPDADEELICSRGGDRSVPSSLSEAQMAGKALKRALCQGEEPTDVPSDGCGPDTCRKKAKAEMVTRFDCSKSFSPKRKWMKESMQEMLEDAEQPQETSSLPIKQRVKLNLRSLPEATSASEDWTRPPGISSNFTIERLCSSDAAREKDCPDRSPERLSPGEPLAVSLKEERVSDSEDADVDVLSTTPVEKKSFDFSSYGFGKRRSFSVQFKLTVLDAFYNDKDCNKNQRATARKFNINRRQVQKWLSQESDLRSEGSVKNGKYLQRQRLGGETREGEGCARCPQHCLRKREVEEGLEKTIKVSVQHCSDKECLSRRETFSPGDGKCRLSGGMDFCSKNLFQSGAESFESSDSLLAVTPHDIARRYQDISLVLFKELMSNLQPRQSFLSFGVNRRRTEYSNFGNEPFLIRKPTAAADGSKVCEIS